MRVRRGSVIVRLPLGTRVFVQSFTNAAFLQRVTVQAPTGVSRVFQGRGEGTIIGNASFRTPGTFRGLNFFPVRVTIEHSSAGRFTPSLVIKDKARMRRIPYKTIGVFSEDGVDTDFNDAVITFSFFKNNR